jgi:hypothetical protein
MSDPDVTPEDARRLEEERTRRYKRLDGFRDRDALQAALARDQTLWDKDAPIVVFAAKLQAAEERRLEARRARIIAEWPSEPEPVNRFDPLALVLAREEFAQLRAELGELDPRDLLVLWLNAAGYSEEDIARAWDAQGLQPPSPSLASLRQRRARVRRRLRRRLGLEED